MDSFNLTSATIVKPFIEYAMESVEEIEKFLEGFGAPFSNIDTDTKAAQTGGASSLEKRSQEGIVIPDSLNSNGESENISIFEASQNLFAYFTTPKKEKFTKPESTPSTCSVSSSYMEEEDISEIFQDNEDIEIEFVKQLQETWKVGDEVAAVKLERRLLSRAS